MDSAPTDIETFNAALAVAVEGMGLTLQPKQNELMAQHFELVLETNRQFNLTRITEPIAAASRLYADSLAPAAWVDEGNHSIKTVLDVGTGAGFPAIPLAIARPTWKITAIDSTGKKARFVQQSAADLGLDNLRAKQLRAGEATFRQRFDMVTTKAVGSLQNCIQIATRHVNVGGHLVVFKARGLSDSEQQQGIVEAENHQFQLVDVCDYRIPAGDDVLEHCLIVYQKGGR
ncbi:MAG: ribosomal RNA small subunit methyltransferase G [Phycisphaerae bacterium]|nr:MAG: ribosomal RNA small subunit methyltransferase G [Phycisphaerae bacterium]